MDDPTTVDPKAELRRLVRAHEAVLHEFGKAEWMRNGEYRTFFMAQAVQTLRRLAEEIDKL
jgi:hypothetical protein